jgi:hypothetical protein
MPLVLHRRPARAGRYDPTGDAFRTIARSFDVDTATADDGGGRCSPRCGERETGDEILLVAIQSATPLMDRFHPTPLPGDDHRGGVSANHEVSLRAHGGIQWCPRTPGIDLLSGLGAPSATGLRLLGWTKESISPIFICQ